MNRRTLLQAAVGSIALAAPRIGMAEDRQVLTFIPVADLAILDSVWTAARPTRNHGYLVFDTLYGIDEQHVTQPQMVEGHTVENDGKLWTLTLREGLRFHDGEPVRGVDVVASVRRIAAREGFAQALMAATDELSARSDRVVQFRLKKPFPHLAEALAGSTASMPAIMPEHLARTDPFTRVTEMVGSGPYRFVANEHVAGSRVVYHKVCRLHAEAIGSHQLPGWSEGGSLRSGGVDRDSRLRYSLRGTNRRGSRLVGAADQRSPAAARARSSYCHRCKRCGRLDRNHALQPCAAAVR